MEIFEKECAQSTYKKQLCCVIYSVSIQNTNSAFPLRCLNWKDLRNSLKMFIFAFITLKLKDKE